MKMRRIDPRFTVDGGRDFALRKRGFVLQEQDQYVVDRSRVADELFKANLREVTGGSQTLALREDGFELALMVGMRAVGAMAWRPATLSREVATAVCAQVGIAMTRAMAIEATARMEASREGETIARRADRLPDTRVADAADVDSRGSDNADAG